MQTTSNVSVPQVLTPSGTEVESQPTADVLSGPAFGFVTFLALGDTIVIAGSTNVAPGSYTITALTSTTFAFTVANGTMQGADTGTITANVPLTITPIPQNLTLGDIQRDDTVGGHTMTLDWSSFYNAGQNANGYLLPAPCAMFMTSTAGEGTIAIHGDSIAAGVGDRTVEGPSGGTLLGDADGVLGFLGRWLNRQGYSFSRHAIPGQSAAHSTSTYFNRGLSARFATTHLSEMGHNDAISSLSTYQSILKPWWAMLRAINGGRVVQTVLTPAVGSSTDTYKTRANQSVSNGPSSYQYTAIQPYLLGTLSPANGDPDAAIDVNTPIQQLDGTTTLDGAWPANGAAYGGTQDGTHPSGGGHSAIANALGAQGQSFATTKLGFAP
jgi:lysophospholipase L1-like esterase